MYKILPAYTDSFGIPVFTAKSFLKPDESIYIHNSADLPDYVGTVHKHEFIEIVFVLSGKANHYTSLGSFDVHAGDLIVVERNVPHAFYADAAYGEKFCAFDLMFTPDCIDSSLIDLSSFKDLCSSLIFYSTFPKEKLLKPTLKLNGAHYNYFGEIFNKIYDEYKSKEAGYNSIMKAYVTELIVKMLRRMNIPKQDTTSSKRQIIDKIIAYLNSHYNKRITLDELAKLTFFSKDYISRLFKDITGENAHAFLQNLRLGKSCELLKDTELTVAEIAYNCGYDDLRSFYKAFKKKYGVTPTQYKHN